MHVVRPLPHLPGGRNEESMIVDIGLRFSFVCVFWQLFRLSRSVHTWQPWLEQAWKMAVFESNLWVIQVSTSLLFLLRTRVHLVILFFCLASGAILQDSTALNVVSAMAWKIDGWLLSAVRRVGSCARVVQMPTAMHTQKHWLWGRTDGQW